MFEYKKLTTTNLYINIIAFTGIQLISTDYSCTSRLIFEMNMLMLQKKIKKNNKKSNVQLVNVAAISIAVPLSLGLFK